MAISLSDKANGDGSISAAEYQRQLQAERKGGRRTPLSDVEMTKRVGDVTTRIRWMETAPDARQHIPRPQEEFSTYPMNLPYATTNRFGALPLEREMVKYGGMERKSGWVQYACQQWHKWWSNRGNASAKCPICTSHQNTLKSVHRGAPLRYDLAGKVYGKLTAQTHEGSGDWRCLCECGNEKIAPSGLLRHNKVTSCGKCPKDVKRPGGTTPVQVTPEAKKLLDRIRHETGITSVDLASAAIIAQYGE